MTTGAGLDKVLTTDASGVASWQTPAGGGTNYWTLSGTNLFPTSTSYNVGIGTTAPLSKLSINGGLHVGGDSDAGDNNILADGTISAATGATGGFRSTTYTAGQNLIWAFGNSSGYGFSYQQGGPDDIRFHFGNYAAPQFLIRSDGNVGIGKTNPGTALDVAGTVTATQFVGGGAGITGVTATNADTVDSYHATSFAKGLTCWVTTEHAVNHSCRTCCTNSDPAAFCVPERRNGTETKVNSCDELQGTNYSHICGCCKLTY